MFYIPNVPYGAYLALKARHTAFFSAANPAIKSSGNGTESKYETIQLVPEEYKPKSILVTQRTKIEDVLNLLNENKISYPIIAKPDIGFRGLLVKKIVSEEQLKIYLTNYPINIIIQEFLDYKNECGVFYYRNPNSKTGTISSLTLKKFSSVTGDGNSSIKELINNDDRAKIYLPLFQQIHQNKINSIPKKNEIIKLTDIGNHSKGTQFLNGNHLISKKLENTFDNLSNNIDGWFYGRVDIKYNDFEDLENGTEFKILEINGIISEPTHIYDKQNNSYLKALKAIRNHWKFLYKISVTNHKKFNIPYKKTSLFINELIQLRNYTSTLKKLK